MMSPSEEDDQDHKDGTRNANGGGMGEDQAAVSTNDDDAKVVENGSSSSSSSSSNQKEPPSVNDAKDAERNGDANSTEEEKTGHEEPTPPPVTRGFVQQPPPTSTAAAADSAAAVVVGDVTSSLAKTQLTAATAVQTRTGGSAAAVVTGQQQQPLLELRQINIGEPGVRSKLRFEVVTARVIELAGKKHVSYSIMMKRLSSHSHQSSLSSSSAESSHSAAVIERRYNDFCFVYECILRNFHPSVLGDFMFPKKVLIGNFKAEVITERTEAFHKFLNLIANCDNLLYSDYFYSFLSSEEHNEAISHIKLARYEEAIPLLENIFYVREKLLTISHVNVLQCLCELISTLHAVGSRSDLAFSYTLVALRSFELTRGHPEAESLRVPFLQLAGRLAEEVGRDRKMFDKQLAELRYKGVRLDNAKPLLEVIREKYIHRASHTAKIT